MMNVVFNHDTVADHLEWFPCEYLNEKICIVVFGVDMYRGRVIVEGVLERNQIPSPMG